MPTITISRDMLIKAITAEVKRQSFGSADMDITFIEGVTASQESFEITGIRVQAQPRKSAQALTKQHTPPAGLGKIRLAAVNGENR